MLKNDSFKSVTHKKNQKKTVLLSKNNMNNNNVNISNSLYMSNKSSVKQG